jgi:transcriptional regulator with XRE-family HTH domain
MSPEIDHWETQRAAVRTALKDRAISQAEFAYRLGITEKHMSQILTGRAAGSIQLWARGEGLMLWATQDPMAEAVHTRNGWRFLLPDGSWIEAVFIDWKPGLVSRAVTLPPPGEAG